MWTMSCNLFCICHVNLHVTDFMDFWLFLFFPCSTVFFLVFISFIFTARRYASAVLAVIVCPSVRPSVCPSVCLSVTSRSCTKMAKPRIRLTTPYDSPETLVFRCQKSWRNSNDITPNGGAKQRGVGSQRRFAGNISLYLRNGARQEHNCYERLIKTRMCYIELHYFQ